MPKKASLKQKVVQPVANKKNKKAAKAPPPESSSEEESSEEEEVVPAKQAKKVAPAKPVKKAESSEEESSEEESEEEVAPKKAAKPAVKQVNGKAKNGKAKEESSDESDDDEDESEEEPEPVKKKDNKRKADKAVVQAPVVKKQKKEESEEEESSEDDDSEEEAPAKKAAPAKQKSKDDSDEESSEDDDDDDDSEEEKPAKAKESKKRKSADEDESPAKKSKMDESGEEVTLFVGNLEPNTTEEEVAEFFTDNDVAVKEARKPPNKRNAFVDLEDASDLDKALALAGASIGGSVIKIDRAKPRGPPKDQNQSFGNKSFNSSFGGGDGQEEKDSRTLFVKNLPYEATQDSLGEIFDQAQDIRIPQKDGYAKGFAFVEFADSESLEKAMKDHQGADCGGRQLFLDYMGSKSSFKGGDRGGRDRGRGGRGRGGFDSPRGGSSSGARGETKTLFVKNLSWDTDEHSLKSAFEGSVHARIPTFPDSGKPKGFAFIEFSSADAASSAHDSMSGETLDGRQITVDFAADKGSGGGGFGGGRGGGGFGGRGGGFGRGRGGDRGGRGFGRGRGGDRGRGGRGGFNKERGGILPGSGKKKTFDDSD